LTNSPYNGETAYDPDNDITLFLAELADFKTDTDAISPATDWVSYVTSAISQVDTAITDSSTIDTVSAAHADLLDDRLTTDVLPRYQAGMRDINAVISSSFTIGQAVLEAFNTREVAEFDAKLRAVDHGQRNQLIFQGVKDMMELLQIKMNFKDSVAKTTIEAYRIKAVLKKEELDEQLDIDDKDYRYPLELYQYGSNVMSSISGSALHTGKTPSKAGSVLGGALSGAAAGAMVGSSAGPYGAAIGGVIGGIGGLLTS